MINPIQWELILMVENYSITIYICRDHIFFYNNNIIFKMIFNKKMVLKNSSANRNIFQKSDSFKHIKCTKLHWNITIRHNSIYIHSIILYFKLTWKNISNAK